MTKFVVPANSVWTWDEPVEVTPPGAEAPQVITMTFRTVEDVAGLLQSSVEGEATNADLIRALATGWDAAFEDGAPIPIDGDKGAPLLAQPWISTPILRAYLASAGLATAKNSPPSAAPGHAPGMAPAANRATRRAAAKTVRP
ncbi:hypothetical protein [Roseospira visakhapatnamensis]|uniref:Tail assembly chaperone n=1 Tax=Roseospira visakhapatnamensis TaxID=390880 RepID=A0A7W6RGQ5_9PROT|nr:hypothetical protein [Roseospira visakhapatnamensis]MBB4268147.1 hypothetical protein [Roseospira visakhapatnamensis]